MGASGGSWSKTLDDGWDRQRISTCARTVISVIAKDGQEMLGKAPSINTGDPSTSVFGIPSTVTCFFEYSASGAAWPVKSLGDFLASMPEHDSLSQIWLFPSPGRFQRGRSFCPRRAVLDELKNSVVHLTT